MLTRREATLIGFLVVALLALLCNRASAADVFNVSRNGVPQFCAPNLTVSAGVYNFTGDCTTPPPNDPGAYTTLVVTWLSHASASGVTDVTQFANLFGRTAPNTPIVPLQWTYAGGTTIKVTDNTDKYLRLRAVMPLNPGTLSHFIKMVSYGTTIPVRIALVPVGAPWPVAGTPASACYVPLAVNDRPAIYINPGAFNASKCSAPAGTVYDVLIDATNNQRGTIALSFN